MRSQEEGDVKITSNPYQGLKLGVHTSQTETNPNVKITSNPYQGLKQPETSSLNICLTKLKSPRIPIRD